MAHKIFQDVILRGLTVVTTVFLRIQRPKLPERLFIDIRLVLVVIVGELCLDALLAMLAFATVLLSLPGVNIMLSHWTYPSIEFTVRLERICLQT